MCAFFVSLLKENQMATNFTKINLDLLSPEQKQIVEDSRFSLEKSQVSLFDSLAYILGGDATFTAVSISTENRFTFKCTRAKKWSDITKKEEWQDRWFVKVLTGPDNCSNYTYMGTIDNKASGSNKWYIRQTQKSGVTVDALSWKSFVYILDKLQNGFQFINERLSKEIKIYHDGTCSMCGRKLTDPVSLRVSLGPICAPEAHKSFKAGCKKRGIVIDKKNNTFIYPERSEELFH
jgi:hypothetical protein